MNNLLDDVSPIVASPIPRRQAFKLLGGALGGAVLAALGLGSATRLFADNCTPLGATCCPSSGNCQKCCSTGSQTCCSGSAGNGCCDKNQACCGNGTKCCQSNQVCCNQMCCTAGPSPSNPCAGAKKCS